MSSIFNHLLASLCVADLVFLLSNLLVAPIAFGFIHNYDIIYPIAECFSHISLAAGIFLTISISLERYQVIKWLISRVLHTNF